MINFEQSIQKIMGIKKNSISFLIWVLFSLIVIPEAAGQTNIYDSIFIDGRWRTFLTHLPSGYHPAIEYPLVLAFHSSGSSGYSSIQYQSRLSIKSDSSRFIVVYPEAVSLKGKRTWNAGDCCAPATTSQIDDVAFVNAILNHLFVKLKIDTIRVYATGFSDGALFCYRLANELSHRFAAIAPVAGGLVQYPWNPSKAVPIISFHSYKDINIKYNGGISEGSVGIFMPSQDSMFQVISDQYACKRKKQTIYHNASTYDLFKYSSCNCRSVIDQYVSYDGDHSWPGGLQLSSIPVSGAMNATFLMWQFFQEFTTTNCLMTDLDEVQDNGDVILYPNPFSSQIRILDSKGFDTFVLSDLLGNKLWSGQNLDHQDFSYLNKGLYLIQIGNKKVKVLKD